MAQPCARPAREDGGHVVAPDRRRAVADGVDAVVDAMQPSVNEPALDRMAIDARGDELPPRHAAVLPAGELGRCVESAAHTAA